MLIGRTDVASKLFPTSATRGGLVGVAQSMFPQELVRDDGGGGLVPVRTCVRDASCLSEGLTRCRRRAASTHERGHGNQQDEPRIHEPTVALTRVTAQPPLARVVFLG